VPTVDAVIEEWEFDPSRIDVLQLTGFDPADGDGNLAPGTPIKFDLLNSAHSQVHDFEGGADTGWTRLLYDDGWTHATWNNGTGDEWDVYDDDGNYVYRAQAQATSVLPDDELVVRDSTSDSVVRVKWFTGATAGLCGHVAWKASAYKTTYGIYGVGAEIDSGGLRLVRYYNNNGTRGVIATSSFTPTNDTWYWIRLQHISCYTPYVRAKYWTGARLDEPATWNISWVRADALYQVPSSWQYTGFGVRCHGGSAYFDGYENFCAPDNTSLSKLTVTVDGTACTIANGRLTVRLNTQVETRESWTLPVPAVNNWHVEVNWSEIAQAITGTITVVVDYDGVELSSTDFDVTRIPGAWPTYDPATDSPSGDPDRMSWFDLLTTTATTPEGVFSFFRTIFPLSWGYQDAQYTIAPATWPSAFFEDFTWLLYTPYYTPVDGLYMIGHPVWSHFSASVVPAIPAIGDFPSDAVVRGSKESLFPSDIVVQGYKRTDFPALVIPSYQLWWEGASSFVVGEEIVQEFDASALLFMRRAGTVVHLRVMSQTTHDKLLEMGVKWSLPITATTDEWEWDEQHISVNEPWYDDAWAYRVKVTVAASKVYADITDLDVLLTEANFPAHFWSNVMSTGADIVVTDSTATLAGKRYRDLIAFDRTAQTMQLRFRGNVDSDTDTDFYVYYGNPSGTETNSALTYGKLDAQGSLQRLRVYYTMQQDPGGGSPQLTDRAGYGNYHGVAYNMASGNRVASYGDLGYAWDFDGTAERVENASDFAYYMYYQIYSAWVNADNVTAGGTIMCYWRNSAGNYHQCGIAITSDKKIQAYWYNSTTRTYRTCGTALTSGWHHVVVGIDAQYFDVDIWIDGAQVVQDNNVGTINIGGAGLRWAIGARRNPSNLAVLDWFKGQIDECRCYLLGTTDLGFPGTEVQTRYANESDPATFYAVGTPESKP
jgi:hypothetical protein